MSILQPTTYQSPPRLGRGRHLNTILEEKEDAHHASRSDSEGDNSDTTIIGRPAAWNPSLFTATPRKSSLATTAYASSPVSSCDPSPANSAGEGIQRHSVRTSYSGSDSGTVFSDDCPSLASDPTTFASESSRNSLSSNRSSRNRYPALLIPTDSWASMDSPIKEIAYGMSPATKIRLSPTALSSLARALPAINAPPSLGDSNSTTSDSPCISIRSAPVTPDMRQLQTNEGQEWGTVVPMDLGTQSLQIALDDGHSIILSPAEAYSANSAHVISALRSPVDWSEIVVSFPQVPGATPQDLSPLMPTLDELRPLEHKQPSNGSDLGVRLPLEALQTLQRMSRQRSPDDASSSSDESRRSRKAGQSMEMRQVSEGDPISRPRSADGVTPVSDYSFSQLSIPSPGGFFSSLQNGSRHTWCLSKPKGPSMPNTATAELFYNRPWEACSSGNVVETVLSVEDTNQTEGPPTARQATFDLAEVAPPKKRTSQQSEDTDLYGPSLPQPTLQELRSSFEYDEKYFDELKHSSGTNLDRTGSWLADQTGYISALLGEDSSSECGEEPVLDPQATSVNDVAVRRTVQFSNQVHTEVATAKDDCNKDSPNSEPEVKEPIFLSAFQHLAETRRSRDAFIHAASRLEAVQSARVAMPEKHMTNILGQHVMTDPTRPKYAGPFSQNPRRTGVFERTEEQIAFAKAEREQAALASIEPSGWQTDALRSLYHGRLLASTAACTRLGAKSTLPLDDPSCIGKKRIRILDFGGMSSTSWAWSAALEWPNVKTYTVVTKEQAQMQRPAGCPKPEAPSNHRTVSVPHLWQLPFRSGHFDVISARSLHVLLKNNPVPGVPEIDEWDMTLKECMRVLKPGGYLDYMIMDSTIAHAGPRGEAMGVEFGFELHRRGYAREAGRSWLRRLKKEGFVGVKRAWMFMPMGRKPIKELEEHVHGYTGGGGWQSWRQGAKPFVPAPRPISEVSTISKIVKQYMDVEAVQGPVGSTQDVADLTGLLGARMWEEWVVKVRSESGREQSRWMDGIDEMIEEGKEQGSGWKVLIGWARKPKASREQRAERAEITVAVEDLDELTSSGDETMETGMIPMLIQE